MKTKKFVSYSALLITLMISACNSDTTNTPTNDELDNALRQIINDENLSGDPSSSFIIPDISDPLPQLGMKLFFSKSLGGNFDSACASCHHPALGGDDDLSLSIGVDAINPDQLGEGRENSTFTFPIPRNAPTTFNAHLYQQGLFWDSRVEQLDGGIRTPDTSINVIDANAGNNLLMAQARFPVTSDIEMRGSTFEDGSSNDDIRDHLAARIGGYDGGFGAEDELATNEWLLAFQTAFGSSDNANNLITFSNISLAIAEYEKSQTFVDTDWRAYIEGDNNALTESAKRGAILFFTPANQGGADCSRCHQGDLFSDERHHVIAFPQFGPGKGDGATGNDDFGRGRETGNINNRYEFRTPSLLNVSLTAPYTHTGAYQTLEEVIRHYDRPQNGVDFFDNANWCNAITQFQDVENCNTSFPDAATNTQNALNRITDGPGPGGLANINLSDQDVTDIAAFLHALTDACAASSSCISQWVPDTETTGPDGQQLNAVDIDGDEL